MIDPDEGFLKTNSLPTAGAITVQDAQGRLVTQKVKVRRYAAGKLPEYAKNALMNDDDDDDDDDNDQEEKDDIEQVKTSAVSHNEQEDRRMRRLQARDLDDNDNERERINRHRRIMEPEVLEPSSEEEEEAEEEENDEEEKMETDETVNRSRVKMDIESSSDDEELNEEQIERHRQLLRQKAKEREEELLQVEEEEEDAEEDDEDEDEESEEESEEEEDDGVPRLKPVFVRKDDRRTVAEREAEEKKQIQLEIEKKRIADQRKVQSQKMVADAIRQEKLAEKKTEDGIQCDFDTDDDDSEVAYDAWKLRELTRLKRDREERDQREREQQELERWHNMTEDERQAELRKNPKLIDNQIKKTKYKFLQKYYHRGAFFMDTNEDVYKRDISEPTLEDLFDKTVLPKVMQVKNFGMAGRTKYTHLVDQDTTVKDSPWALDKQTAKKFHNEHAGGLKQEFDRPKLKKTSKK